MFHHWKPLLSQAQKAEAPLLVDILFPTRFSQWRIAEITSFIKEKRADILVFKIKEFAGVSYEVDYEMMRDRQGFRHYDILVFDPQYNYLNKYNRRVDGTRWNGTFPASYLFTRHADFDLRRYTFVYHIFLMCYQQFNKVAAFPPDRQAIRMYPGGGYVNDKSLEAVHLDTHVIATHPNTSAALQTLKHPNVFECLGGSFISEDMPSFALKELNRGTLTVCFASMGHAEEKGSDIFFDIAAEYRRRFKGAGVRFVAIGNASVPAGVERVTPMPMHELMSFYRDDVDIMISIDTAKAFNGWPLGVEAALNGAVLVTTDSSHANQHFQFPDQSLFIFDLDKRDDVVAFIRQLDADRQQLLYRSRICQKAFLQFYSYDAQQAKVFEYLDTVFAENCYP